jgi:hypothetical protein
MRENWGSCRRHPKESKEKHPDCSASIMRLTGAGDLAHKGAMKRTSSIPGLNIRCGIIISS